MIIASLLAILFLTSPQAYEQLSIINYITKSAEIHGLDSFIVLSLASCESGMNPLAAGDFRSETGEYMAVGLFQFWPDTWSYYSKKYNIKGTREDPFASTDLAVLMLRDGHWKKWYNCYKLIERSSS